MQDILKPFNHAKRGIYKKLASSVSHGEHRVLENAGHASIHIDCPDEVVEAILDLLERNKE